MAGPHIRPMTAADLEAAAAMILRGEWGDRSVFLEWALSFAPSHPFVADDDGQIVGTGIATANGPVGWVGTIFVDRDRRREGLGRRLTATVIDDLEGRGCRSLVLIASNEGRPLYEGLGFRVHGLNRRFTAAGLAPDADDGSVRPFEPAMLPALVEQTRRATGEDRSAILASVAAPATARVVVGDDGSLLASFVRAPWGGGALIAPDPDDAMRILEWRRRQVGPAGHVNVSLPDTNDGRPARLLADGWVPSGAGTRMERGEPLDARLDWLWGHLSGAIG
jgi:GNAT superfamily N-acetyltransferase